MTGRGVERFLDPDGVRHGVPSWPWRMAPDGLCTRRQLAAAGLRPGGQPVAGLLLWSSRRYTRRGTPQVRFAVLYRADLAVPRREPTTAQLVALAKADRARRTCRTCTRVQPYVIPRSLGECVDCADAIAAQIESTRRPGLASQTRRASALPNPLQVSEEDSHAA